MDIVINQLLFLTLFLLPVAPQNLTSSRLVITFQTRADNLASNAGLVNATLVKRYGRRLVLDLRRPFDFGEEADAMRSVMLAVEHVEMDYLVSVDEFNDTVYSDDLNSMVVAQQGFTGAVPPLTQWNLKDSEPYSIHAEKVWASSNSTPDVVVAVIDTGLATPAREYFLHVVGGYDFISDSDLALDLDGRDADATDPGDWGDYCPTPSWHGTRVASILAARHDNKFGMRGVAQNCSVMPVRVLGLCKMGYANDVTDAIVWAAGGTIDGVPINPLPAKILSLSLAGAGDCPSYLQSAIDLAITLGSVVITAAGNNNKDASGYFPANCKGVIAVAASTRQGTLAGYSNFGNIISLSAPGGDSMNPIMTLRVDALETDLQIFNGIGTSFAVPHVAAIGALVYSSSRMKVKFDLKTMLLLPATNTSVHNIIEMKKFTDVFESYENTNVVALITEECATSSVFRYCDPNKVNLGDINECQCVCSANSYHEIVLQALSGGSVYYEACLPCPTCSSGSYRTSCGCASQSVCLDKSKWLKPNDICGLCALNCQACTCPGGQYKIGCSGTSSGLCSACTSCSAGQYNNGCSGTSSGTCTACVACPLGSYYSSACTGLSAGTCATCPTCPYSQYRSGCSGTSSGSCVACTSCPAGQYNYGCMGTSSGTCLTCPTCPDGQFLDGCSGLYSGLCTVCTWCSFPGTLLTPCTGTSRGTCSTVSCVTCALGEYAQGCSGTNPGVCTMCGACPVATPYRIGCSGISSGVCRACAKCFAGYYLTGCTASSQGTCAMCESCPAGTYRVGCADTNPGVCKRCTSCPSGQFAVACSLDFDGSCSSCGTCSDSYPSFLIGCSGNSPGECYPCTPCSAGFYSKGCAGTSYGTCESCTCPANTYGGCNALTPYAPPTCNPCPSCSAGYTRSGCTGTSSGVCSQCPAGKYSLAGDVACSDCREGASYSSVGSSECLSCTVRSCAVGTKIKECDLSTNSECITCSKPQNSDWVVSATACTWQCTSGFYLSSGSCVACTVYTTGICPIGTYFVQCDAAAIQDSECKACDNKPVSNSFYITSSGNQVNNCQWGCNDGYYLSGNDCVQCGAGYYRSKTDALGSCTACPAGKYSTATTASSSSTCAPCTAFTSCPVGNYFTSCTTTKNSECVACTNGPASNSFYSSSSGTVVNSCQYGCNGGYYLSGSNCATCGAGYYRTSTDVIDTCNMCPSGKYSTVVAAASSTVCSPCTSCPNNGQYTMNCGVANSGTCAYCTNN